MTTAAHTHEELTTKKDVDEGCDDQEQRKRNMDLAFTSCMDQLNIVIASLNDVLLRVTKLEEGQRQIIGILKRIERQTSRVSGF